MFQKLVIIALNKPIFFNNSIKACSCNKKYTVLIQTHLTRIEKSKFPFEH